MVDRITVGGLQVASVLHAFVRDEALPGSGVDEAAFWSGVEALLADFVPRNRALLARRDELQQQLDEWHEKNPGPVGDQAAYVQLLRDLGYLVDEPADFTIETSDVDEEVAVQAGPQLVVPVLNARFAANAANARWGSLYDALYGTDALPEDDGQERGPSYNPKRGAAVIAKARAFLDEHFPLGQGSHADSTGYSTEDGALTVKLGAGASGLADPAQYVGHRGDPADPEGVLLVHHGLHVEIQVDRSDNIGKDDAAGVKDLLMEAAVSTIMDLEDSVAAVDAGRQGGRLPQLAPAQPGHADRRGRQGRVVVHPRTRAGPALRRSERPARAARSVAAVRAPGRSPDDHRRDPLRCW